MSGEYDLKNFVDCGGCWPMRITPYEICIILHIIWNPNPIIVLLSIQYSSYLKNMPTSMNGKFLSSTSFQGLSVAVPFSGDIQDYWRHFTGYRKRLPNSIIASWFKEIAVGFKSFSFCSVETTVI